MDDCQGSVAMRLLFAEVHCPNCGSAEVIEGFSEPVDYLCARCEREFVVEADRAALAAANG